MKRIKFTRTEQFESEGRNKGPVFEKDSKHTFEDAFADRWLRRSAAVDITGLSDKDADAADHSDKKAAAPLSDSTVAQLRAIAAEEQIDLGDATLKADIVSAIELAREAAANG